MKHDFDLKIGSAYRVDPSKQRQIKKFIRVGIPTNVDKTYFKLIDAFNVSEPFTVVVLNIGLNQFDNCKHYRCLSNNKFISIHIDWPRVDKDMFKLLA